MKQKMRRNQFITILRELLVTLLIGAIGAALMIGMFFGAAFQEQDKLAEMAITEISG